MPDDPTPDAAAAPPQLHAIERVEDAPDDVALFALAGELDLACAQELRGAMEAADGRRVVLDLEEVTFIDSSVLKELLRANARLSEGGHALVLVAPQQAVQRLLDLTRTGEMFTIAPDRDSALG